MTDRELIEEILDSVYTFGTTDSGFAAFCDGNDLNFEKFNYQACKIIGQYFTNEGEHSSVIIGEWFKNKQNKLIEDANRKAAELDNNTTKDILVQRLIDYYNGQDMSDKYMQVIATNYYYVTNYKPRLEEYLRSAIVKLGNCDWEIFKDGKPVTTESIKTLFPDEQDNEILAKIIRAFETWCEVAKQNHTQRMMKNF